MLPSHHLIGDTCGLFVWLEYVRLQHQSARMEFSDICLPVSVTAISATVPREKIYFIVVVYCVLNRIIAGFRLLGGIDSKLFSNNI